MGLLAGARTPCGDIATRASITCRQGYLWADLQLGADSIVDGQVDDVDARRRQAVLQNALKLIHLHIPITMLGHTSHGPAFYTIHSCCKE